MCGVWCVSCGLLRVCVARFVWEFENRTLHFVRSWGAGVGGSRTAGAIAEILFLKKWNKNWFVQVGLLDVRV